MRPLLENEITQGVARAPWVLTENSIALRDRPVGRAASVDSREGAGDTNASAASLKTRSELRALDHLRRDDNETIMDAVFDDRCSTSEVYDRSFRRIVAGVGEGLNGAILAFGQTSSGKTFSISGTSAKPVIDEDSAERPTMTKGIIHFALEDLFSQLNTKSAREGAGECEYLVRMSYAELYMERVNDLLRKISPQSQNLLVKEDPEGRGFYVDGLKEKIVGSAEEVLSHLKEAEKRRRVAHTKFNEVSSRSHTLLTLCVECSTQLEDATSTGEEHWVTKVGRLVIVDLAGNERLQAGTEYMAESNSINKSLFFLGKVIEKLSGRDRREPREMPTTDGAAEAVLMRGVSGGGVGEHVPFRDSKLTRLLAIHLGGNSQTGVLVTLTPAEDSIEQSLSTLRFAQKASTIKCTAKPVLISKEQSLIIKQREIIAQLHLQVKELKEAQRQHEEQTPQLSVDAPAASAPGQCAAASQDAEAEVPDDSSVTAERQKRVEQLQALMLRPSSSTVASSASGQSLPARQAYVSQSREVDAVVTALHRSNDTLRRQKVTVIEELKELHRAIVEATKEIADASAVLAKADGPCTAEQAAELVSFSSATRSRPPTTGSGESRASELRESPCEPAMRELRAKIKALLHAAGGRLATAQREQPSLSSKSRLTEDAACEVLDQRLREAEDENRALRQALGAVRSGGGSGSQASPEELSLQEANAKLREENARLLSAAAAPASAASAAPDAQQLREENTRLRASLRFITAERDRLRSASAVPGPEQAALATTGTRAQSPACRAQSPCGQSSARASSSGRRPRSGAGVPRPGSSSGSVGTPPPRGSSSPLLAAGGSITQGQWAEFEPIIERGAGGKLRESRSQSPCRALAGSASGLGEFEPIIERVSSSPSAPKMMLPSPKRAQTAGSNVGTTAGDSSGGASSSSRVPSVSSEAAAPPPRPPPSASGKSSLQPKPPEGVRGGASDAAPRLAMDYFRQLGVRTNWKPGDSAYWRGQVCRVVKAVADEPLRVVLQIPDGAEVTTDICLLSEVPAAAATSSSAPVAASATLRPSDGGMSSGPLRLAPLGDVCLDRVCLDRPRALPPGQVVASAAASACSNGTQVGTSLDYRLRPAAAVRS